MDIRRDVLNTHEHKRRPPNDQKRLIITLKVYKLKHRKIAKLGEYDYPWIRASIIFLLPPH